MIFALRSDLHGLKTPKRRLIEARINAHRNAQFGNLFVKYVTNDELARAAAHRILKRGGRLVILDLLSHRFERARELYADHWLGFSEVQLHQFLEKNSFREIEMSVVAGEKQSPHFQTVFATGIR